MKKEKETKLYFVEYKDHGGYGCGEEMTAMGEHEAVQLLQTQLIDEDDYMTELISVDEIDSQDEDEPVWKLKDGAELEPEYQDALNDAMFNMVNEDGMTLTQVWDKEIEEEEEKEKNK